MNHPKKHLSQPHPVIYKAVTPAPIPTFDDLPPVPPVPPIPSEATEEPVGDPLQEKADKIIAELNAITQRMLESGRMGRANALKEWGWALRQLAEIDQHIADMHELRNALLKSMSEPALDIARTEWCIHGDAAYQLQGSGILARHELTRLTDPTDINEETYDLEKEYM